MTKLECINYAVDLLLVEKELGATDGGKLNLLLSLLNADGWVDKADLIQKVFTNGKNPDTDLRNFQSRVRYSVITVANHAEEQGETEKANLIRSLRIDTMKASSQLPARIEMSATAPPPILPDTRRANLNYLSKNFQPPSGMDPQEQPSPDAFTLFISFAETDAFLVNLFIKQFEELIRSKPLGTYRLIYWSMHNLIAGKDFDQQIKSSLRNCHYGLALVSEAFVNSSYIKEVELTHFFNNQNIIPVGLNSTLNGKSTPGNFFSVLSKNRKKVITQLRNSQISYLKDPRPGHFYNECTQEQSQKQFVDVVYKAIQARIEHDINILNARGFSKEQAFSALLTKSANQTIDSLLASNRIEQYPTQSFEELQAEHHNMQTLTEKDIDRQHSPVYKTSNVDLIPAMLDWAQNINSPSLFALLGDYGMGKTFSCRVFAEQLAQLCQTKPHLPKPIYLDLRDVRTLVEENGINRQPYLSEMLGDILRFHPDTHCSSETIIQAARTGKALLIFDGLDEKIVYYSKDMCNQFFNELLSLYPQEQTSSSVKILLSCRSHHFETLSRQNTFLTGLGRSGVRGQHYLALTILPLSKNQMQSLLNRLLSEQDSQQIFAFIQEERYLKDLAARPFMLNKLAQSLPRLQQLKAQNKPINAASFYQALIERHFPSRR